MIKEQANTTTFFLWDNKKKRWT